MPAPSLPELPPDLHWLITMEPTLPNLDDFIEGRNVTGRSGRARGRRFSISHIFSVTDPISWYQNHFRLDHGQGEPGLLAGERGYDLLMPDIEKDLCALSSDGFTEEVIEACRYDFVRHCADIDQLCQIIAAQWYEAFRLYDDPHGYMGMRTELLYLEPHITCPPRSLIDDLCTPAAPGSKKAWHLLLLTARHELGYIYTKVADWYDRSLNMDVLEPSNECLSEDDRNRLCTRAGGYPVARAAQTSSRRTRGRRRDDKPEFAYVPASDLARLYLDMFHWYETVYAQIVEAMPCEDCGKRAARPRSMRCAECAAQRKRQQDREAYEERMRNERDPTPSLAKKYPSLTRKPRSSESFRNEAIRRIR